MPISIEKLAEAVRTVEFDFLNDKVHVDYRLGAFNAEYSDWVSEGLKSDDGVSIRDSLERVLCGWDVLDAQGQPIPTTAEAMKQYALPTPFLRAVQDAILDDAQPGKLKRSPSSAGSARAAR